MALRTLTTVEAPVSVVACFLFGEDGFNLSILFDVGCGFFSPDQRAGRAEPRTCRVTTAEIALDDFLVYWVEMDVNDGYNPSTTCVGIGFLS